MVHTDSGHTAGLIVTTFVGGGLTVQTLPHLSGASSEPHLPAARLTWLHQRALCLGRNWRQGINRSNSLKHCLAAPVREGCELRVRALGWRPSG